MSQERSGSSEERRQRCLEIKEQAVAALRESLNFDREVKDTQKRIKESSSQEEQQRLKTVLDELELNMEEARERAQSLEKLLEAALDGINDPLITDATKRLQAASREQDLAHTDFKEKAEVGRLRELVRKQEK
jgi:dihydropteroate synthase